MMLLTLDRNQTLMIPILYSTTELYDNHLFYPSRKRKDSAIVIHDAMTHYREPIMEIEN